MGEGGRSREEKNTRGGSGEGEKRVCMCVGCCGVLDQWMREGKWAYGMLGVCGKEKYNKI